MTDYVKWAKEGHKIAKDFVYEGITEDKPVPEDYIVAGKKIAEKQLVIGGYRLYHYLKDLKLSKHTNGHKFSNLMSVEPLQDLPVETDFLQK